jgi:hypothetical protein
MEIIEEKRHCELRSMNLDAKGNQIVMFNIIITL